MDILQNPSREDVLRYLLKHSKLDAFVELLMLSLLVVALVSANTGDVARFRTESSTALYLIAAGFILLAINMVTTYRRARYDLFKERAEAALLTIQRERDEARTQLGELRAGIDKPKVTGAIIQVVAAATDDNGETRVAIIVRLENSGRPTIVQGYDLFATLSDRRMIQLELLHINEPVTLHGEGGGETTYTKENLVYEKTIRTPIETGGGVTGILYARTSDANQQELMAKGVVFRLECFDIISQAIVAEATMAGNRETINKMYYPGM